ncbi:unnamed protein product [Menidia menidia]|uniref:(Atlantic silverside) hypothetical protein n=1 Tax=Menidia menidia TaxID=238744 RepID=A0A8S4BXX5_9TELE|nr:unnamed protein product [Menidia menidia]
MGRMGSSSESNKQRDVVRTGSDISKTFKSTACIGVCVTFTSTYTLVKGFESWFWGRNYCSEKYTSLMTVDSSSLNDKLKGAWSHSGKVWIGLRAGLVSWTWPDGEEASYFNWGPVVSDSPYEDLCAVISDSGAWTNLNCSLLRPSVCSNGSHFTLESEMSWTEARANCEDKNLTLVHIPDNFTNDDVRSLLPSRAEAWIGLSRSLIWFWSDTGGRATFLNWEPGQPDNLSGNELCAALLLGNGTWSDEPCEEPYYFICQGRMQKKPLSRRS